MMAISRLVACPIEVIVAFSFPFQAVADVSRPLPDVEDELFWVRLGTSTFLVTISRIEHQDIREGLTFPATQQGVSNRRCLSHVLGRRRHPCLL